MKKAIYVAGIIILTLGIAFTIHSNFGTSPFDALLVGLADQIGLTVGSWEIIIAFLLILSNAALSRKRLELTGLITAFITGVGIDCWLFLFSFFSEPVHVFSKFLCFTIGLVIVGLGTAIYLHANFAPIPIDRLMLIIHELTKMNLLLSRTVIYVLFLTMAFIFSGPIGIGTILTVLLGGPLFNFFMPLVEKTLTHYHKKMGTLESQ